MDASVWVSLFGILYAISKKIKISSKRRAVHT